MVSLMIERKCHVHPDKLRAALAIAAPLLPLGGLVYDMRADGLSPWEYFVLLASTVPEALVTFVVLMGYWIYRYWPPAIEALECGSCLVHEKSGRLYLAGNRDLALDELSEILGRTDLRGSGSFLRTRLAAKCFNRHCSCGSVVTW